MIFVSFPFDHPRAKINDNLNEARDEFIYNKWQDREGFNLFNALTRNVFLERKVSAQKNM